MLDDVKEPPSCLKGFIGLIINNNNNNLLNKGCNFSYNLRDVWDEVAAAKLRGKVKSYIRVQKASVGISKGRTGLNMWAQDRRRRCEQSVSSLWDEQGMKTNIWRQDGMVEAGKFLMNWLFSLNLYFFRPFFGTNLCIFLMQEKPHWFMSVAVLLDVYSAVSCHRVSCSSLNSEPFSFTLCLEHHVSSCSSLLSFPLNITSLHRNTRSLTCDLSASRLIKRYTNSNTIFPPTPSTQGVFY